MKMNKKALSVAITMSLVLGVYGVAGARATDLYGAGESASSPNNNIYLDTDGKSAGSAAAVVTANKIGEAQTYVTSSAITDYAAAASNSAFTVTGGTWVDVWRLF